MSVKLPIQDPQKVYIMREDKTNNYKIGISNKPPKRMKQLQTGNSHSIKLLFECQIDPNIKAKDVETVIHTFLKENGKWIRGEWFQLSEESVFNIAKTMMLIGDNVKNKNFETMKLN